MFQRPPRDVLFIDAADMALAVGETLAQHLTLELTQLAQALCLPPWGRMNRWING
jgi:hypothetical protein